MGKKEPLKVEEKEAARGGVSDKASSGQSWPRSPWVTFTLPPSGERKVKRSSLVGWLYVLIIPDLRRPFFSHNESAGNFGQLGVPIQKVF
jgi:hypothetical protein